MNARFMGHVMFGAGTIIGAGFGCSSVPGDPSAQGGPGEPVESTGQAVTTNGATDPGVRAGAAGLGAPLVPQPIQPDDPASQALVAPACLPGLQPGMLLLCEKANIRFQEIDSVRGATVSTGLTGFIAPGTVETGTGLGPTFNNVGCHTCHSQPGALGAGVSLGSPQFPGVPNPQVGIATLDGAKNTVPFFITPGGPIREVRFKSDNGVHDLYTLAGRSDAAGCNATQPNFGSPNPSNPTTNSANSISFRIPISTAGDGLVEEVTDQALIANLASSQTQFNTGGTFNISGNDGTITRFGWKAQDKSLTIFSQEAYNVEQGVDNFGMTNERTGGASNLQGCFDLAPTQPEDSPSFLSSPSTPNQADASDLNADIFNFTLAMQLSKPPTPTTEGIPTSACDISVFGSCANAAVQGFNEFVNVGCASCHTKQLTTDANASGLDPALRDVTFAPFSDFAIHHMGSGLADGITQGSAGPDQFRTQPLWGVGQRLFLLHDGRTSDLTVAIAAHASPGSDANAVISNFNSLSQSNQQAILVFLRSL
jgi:hypothetical protein